MTHERQPFMKHYPADWRGDANLRMCGLAARGLWIECRGLMHEASPRGSVSLPLEQLALMVGRPLKEVRAAMAELEQHGVTARDEHGRFSCQRMVLDAAKSAVLSENGKRGGNPAILLNQGLNQSAGILVKPLVNPASAPTELLSTECSSFPALGLDLSEPVHLRFEAFWAAYPRHEGRKDALRIFTKLKPDQALLAVMLDAIARWKLSRQWREGVLPHPSTWLNGERWKDEVPPEPVLSGPFRGPLLPVKDNPKAADLVAAREEKMRRNDAERDALRQRESRAAVPGEPA